MDPTDFEKSIPQLLVDLVEYVSGSVVTRTILRQTTGTVTLSSFDTGEVQATQYLPFDHLIQVLDGVASICLEEKVITLETGQAIMIPAHAKHWIKAKKRFKMLSTVIKSGYEEVSIY